MTTPGSALLSMRRTVTDAGGVAAVVVTVLLVCTLVTAVVAAVSSLQRQALLESVRAMPAESTTVELRTSYDPAGADELDAEVRRVLQPVLGVVGGRLVSHIETVDYRQRTGRPWAFASVAGEGAVVAVSGELPPPRADTRVVQVAAPAGGELRQGDRLALVDPLDGDRVQVLVVGTWQPGPDAVRLVPDADRDALLVPDTDISRLAGRAATVSWRAAPSLPELTPAALDDLASAAAAVEQESAELGEAASASLRVQNPLPATAREAIADLTAQRTLLLMPAAILLVLGGAVALLVSSALTGNRAGDEGLLRSRGADRRRLVSPAALEAGVVCLVTGGVATLVAAPVVGLLEVPAELGPSGLAAAALSATVCWAALSMPAVSRALGGDGAMVAALERRRRRLVTLLVAVVVLVLALGAVSLIGLRRFWSAGSASQGVDLLAVTAPALLLAATTTLLGLIVLPAAFRLSTAGSRSRGLALAVGSRAVARSAARAMPLALVVALAAGGLVYAAVERASRTATVEAATADAVGADVRVLAPPSSVRAGPDAERSRLTGLPGVSGVTAVRRLSAFVADVPVDLLVADLGSSAPSVFLPSQSEKLIERLVAPAGGGAVPVVVTDALAESAALRPGASIELFLEQPTVLQVVGTVPDLPTVDEGRTGLLLDARALGSTPEPPDEWWLSVADAAVDEVARTLAQSPAIADEVLTRATVRQRLELDPRKGGTAYDAVLRAGVVGAALLGVVLLTSMVLLRRAERRAASAFLRALGASDRDVTLTAALEQGLVTGGGLVVGALAGTGTAVLARAAGGGGEVEIPWVTTLPVLLGLLLVPPLVLLIDERAAGGRRRGGRPRSGRWSR